MTARPLGWGMQGPTGACRWVTFLLVLLVGQTTTRGQIPAGDGSGASVEANADLFARLPIAFEANRGQVDPAVKFIHHGGGGSLFLTQSEAVVAWSESAKTHEIRMTLVHSNKDLAPAGEELQTGTISYLDGPFEDRWIRNVYRYGRVRYRNVYPESIFSSTGAALLWNLIWL